MRDGTTCVPWWPRLVATLLALLSGAEELRRLGPLLLDARARRLGLLLLVGCRIEDHGDQLGLVARHGRAERSAALLELRQGQAHQRLLGVLGALLRAHQVGGGNGGGGGDEGGDGEVIVRACEMLLRVSQRNSQRPPNHVVDGIVALLRGHQVRHFLTEEVRPATADHDKLVKMSGVCARMMRHGVDELVWPGVRGRQTEGCRHRILCLPRGIDTERVRGEAEADK